MNIGAFLVLAAISGLTAPEQAEFKRLDKAAACLVRKDRVAVANWADTDPGSAEERDLVLRLAPLLTGCADGLNPDALAGAVARRLFNLYATRMRSAPMSKAQGDEFANAELERASRSREGGVLGCLTLLHPEASQAVLRAGLGTKREEKAIQAVLAAMTRCVRSGEQIRWKPLKLRLGLARAVYRRSAAAELAKGAMGPEVEAAARVR
jgi:hypothetical protein